MLKKSKYKPIYIMFMIFQIITKIPVSSAEQGSQAAPHAIPSQYDDWSTLWSKQFGGSLPASYGDSLSGVMLNSRYTREELLASPFVVYLLEKGIVTRERLTNLFNTKAVNSDAEGRKMHGVFLYQELKGFKELSEFNIQQEAKIFAKAQASEEAANIAGREALAEKEKEKYDKMIDAYGAAEEYDLKRFKLFFPIVLFCFFCYGFLLPVFKYLAPTKKPNVVAKTNIILPMDYITALMSIPFYLLNRISFGLLFPSLTTRAMGQYISKGYYPVAVQAQMDEYMRHVRHWSRDPNYGNQNLLLKGLPGTGKSLFFKNVAKIKGIGYIKTNSQLLRQLIDDASAGQVEREIIALFAMAKNYYKRTGKKVIIFIDEAEKLGSSIITLLGLMDSAVSTQVSVILACNDEGKLPDAVRSRMGKVIEVLPPTSQEIEKIITDTMTHLGRRYSRASFNCTPESVRLLSLSLEGSVVGRDIDAKLENIAMNAEIDSLSREDKLGRRATKQSTRVDKNILFIAFGVNEQEAEARVKLKSLEKEIDALDMSISAEHDRSRKKRLQGQLKNLLYTKEALEASLGGQAQQTYSSSRRRRR